ncbi:MAG: hypothetical protein RMM58_15120 [Chloroflexota bacterium]|nr:hypothetical protein [Dehalococcoidia bacterium]MDW8255202.1 hypothetical protein [Chloroflexota bacterium]
MEPSVTTSSPATPRPVVPVRRGISVGDGFRFGCGFILAQLVFVLLSIMAVLLALIVLQVLGLLPNLNALVPPA